MDSKAELEARIRALYRRARENVLAADDILPLASAKTEKTEAFLERIYRDKAAFDRTFADFAAAYDVFGKFTARQVVLDVGAHWGYSVVAMRHQGCRSKIISIEAMPLNIEPLERLKRIEAGSYDFCNVAASDTDEVLRFYIPVLNGHANLGLSTTGGLLTDDHTHLLMEMAERHKAEVGSVDKAALAIADVQAAPIDSILERFPGAASAVAAVKIDVEGHEARALRGASRLLANQKPLLMIEGANRSPAVVAEMNKHGYCHFERHDGVLIPQSEISRHLDGYWLHPDRFALYRQLGLMLPDTVGDSVVDSAEPRGGSRDNAGVFRSTLASLSNLVASHAPSFTSAREIEPPPVLCPKADSLVRLLPLGRATYDLRRNGRKLNWIRNPMESTLVDFLAFEGEDFAYAVSRSLLFRAPRRKELLIARTGTFTARLLLLLETDRKARRSPGLGRLRGVPLIRLLHRIWRLARIVKVRPLAKLLKRTIQWRVRRVHVHYRRAIDERRLLLFALDAASRRD